MIVFDLIAKLQRMPADAVIVVGDNIVHGVELRRGEIEVGYYNPVFRVTPHGKKTAVFFMANTELSTGEVVSVPQ